MFMIAPQGAVFAEESIRHLAAAHKSHADAGRQHAESNHIRQRIDLDAVVALHTGAVFLAAGHDAVKSVAEAGKQQKEHTHVGMAQAAEGHYNTRTGAEQRRVSKPYRIVIKTDHFSFSF